MAGIEVPAPEFKVTVSAETSYSRYINYTKKVSGYTLNIANEAGTGDKVMNISATIGISSKILGGNNYKTLLGGATLTYDGLNMLTSSDVTTNTIYPNTLASDTEPDGNKDLLVGYNVISQAWGSHAVAASYTFDGVKTEHTLPCHVTGLPYNLADNPTKISGLSVAEQPNGRII